MNKILDRLFPRYVREIKKLREALVVSQAAYEAASRCLLRVDEKLQAAKDELEIKKRLLARNEEYAEALKADYVAVQHELLAVRAEHRKSLDQIESMKQQYVTLWKDRDKERADRNRFKELSEKWKGRYWNEERSHWMAPIYRMHKHWKAQKKRAQELQEALERLVDSIEFRATLPTSEWPALESAKALLTKEQSHV